MGELVVSVRDFRALQVQHVLQHVDDPENASLVKRARDLYANSRAPSTIRNYSRHWRYFVEWCEQYDVCPLPATPANVAIYLSEASRKYRVASLRVALSAISVAHRALDLPSPAYNLAVKTMMRGICRTFGTKQSGRAAFGVAEVKSALPLIRDRELTRSAVIRNRALILLGFAAALRRSELVALDISDIDFTDGGLVVLVRSSKTDPYGSGERAPVARGGSEDTCPVEAVRKLTAVAGPTGPLFRRIYKSGRFGDGPLSAEMVSYIVKRYAGLLEHDPSLCGGHSLRVGLITSAHEAGLSDVAIMRQTRSKQVENVRRYVRPSLDFIDSMTVRMGL